MKTSDLSEGSKMVVTVAGIEVAVFRVDGTFFVLNNKCLHRGGPLGEGELAGHTVVCPWHGWRYDVATGSMELIPTLKVRTYNVEIEGDEVFIEIP